MNFSSQFWQFWHHLNSYFVCLSVNYSLLYHTDQKSQDMVSVWFLSSIEFYFEYVCQTFTILLFRPTYRISCYHSNEISVSLKFVIILFCAVKLLIQMMMCSMWRFLFFRNEEKSYQILSCHVVRTFGSGPMHFIVDHVH